LEMLVKCAPRCATEIPIEFQKRLHGESKLSLKEQIKYLLHLKRLYEYKFKTLFEFIKFSLIGFLGMCVDLTFIYIAKDVWLLPFYIARAIGFIFALTSNFLLNRRFTFANAREGNLAKQYISFFVICILGFFVNWLISVCLYYNLPFFYSHYLIASFLGVLGGLTVNFTGSKFIVFK
jgi:dolichol-phosphate mannosyltransferase